VFAGSRLFTEVRTQIVWLIVVLSVTMLLVAWLIAREYARRERAAGLAGDGGVRGGKGNPVLAQ
jgi:hypothetical protein